MYKIFVSKSLFYFGVDEHSLFPRRLSVKAQVQRMRHIFNIKKYSS